MFWCEKDEIVLHRAPTATTPGRGVKAKCDQHRFSSVDRDELRYPQYL